MCLLCERAARVRGLCHRCYARAWWMGMHTSFPRKPAMSKRATYWREYKRRKAAERRAA